jgi:hypothetical protein
VNYTRSGGKKNQKLHWRDRKTEHCPNAKFSASKPYLDIPSLFLCAIYLGRGRGVRTQ